MSLVTCFIPRAHTGNCISYNTVKIVGRGFGNKMKGNGPDKEEIPDSRRSMHGYILTLLQALKEEHMSALGSQ